MLKLSTKCWISAFNAWGSRGIIAAVQVGAVKISVAAVEALMKKETRWNSGTIKIDGFLSFTPRWMLMYFFAGFFWISPFVWPNPGYWCCLFLTLRISLICHQFWPATLDRMLTKGTLSGTWQESLCWLCWGLFCCIWRSCETLDYL
jgi:hypothetical protein